MRIRLAGLNGDDERTVKELVDHLLKNKKTESVMTGWLGVQRTDEGKDYIEIEVYRVLGWIKIKKPRGKV